MIKVEELMLGDFIMLPNGCVTQVTGIDQFVEVKANDDVFAEEDLNPIPLTDSILKNNGFKSLEEDSFVCKELNEENDYRIVVDLLVPFLSYVEKDKHPKARFGGEIKYVHQLQHILKVLNVDKQIIL